MVDVSVCIPVYNEKLALRSTVTEMQEAMDALPYEYEIVLIDDGSTDDCFEAISDLDVRIIRHKRNLGGGIARVTGIKYAKGDIIVQSDADGTYPVDEIGTMLEALKTSDMVIAARRRESATDYRALRILMKWCLKKFATLLSGTDIPDLNSGMRAYKKKLAAQYIYLYPKGHSIMSTMTLAFLSEGLKVAFVPIDYRVRIGKSSFHPIRDTYNYMATIVRTVTYFDPLRVMLPLVIVLAFGAVGFSVRDVALLDVGDVTPMLWAATLLILAIAILSDQMARLSRQVAHLKGKRWTDDEAYEEGVDLPPMGSVLGAAPVEVEAEEVTRASVSEEGEAAESNTSSEAVTEEEPAEGAADPDGGVVLPEPVPDSLELKPVNPDDWLLEKAELAEGANAEAEEAEDAEAPVEEPHG